jgi:hypothetical protein
MKVAILLILSAGFLASGCGKASHHAWEGSDLVGAWRAKIHFKDGAFASIKDLEFMYVFNEGGTITESSNYDGAPPVPPAYGVWRQVGPKQFEAKYTFYITKPPASLNCVALVLTG